MALTKVTGQIIKDTTDVTVGVLTVTNTLAVGGTVSIGGTLTYEDVTNVDAVGLITARNGIVVGSGITLSKDGDIFATGITTVSSRIDVISSENTLGILTSANSGANLDLFDDDTQSRIRTVDGRLHLYADFKNEVSDSAIRFFIDGANEKLRITGIGSVGISSISPEKQLVVRTASGSRGGILVKPDVSFAANQNKSYLIVGTDGWTDADDASGGDWNTYGFQHRIKSNSSGLSRVTIDNYLGEAFCVDNTSKVGITTDLPLARLDVRDTSALGILSRSSSTQATDVNKALKVRNNSTTDTFSVSYKGLTEIKKGEIGNYLTVGGDDANNGRALKFTSSDTDSVGALHTLDAISGNGAIALATAGVERMRVTNAGKVGIGTDNPAQLMELASTAPNIRFTDTVYGHAEIDGNSSDLKFNADKGNTKADSIITFFLDNTQRVKIKDNGEVLVYKSSNGNVFEYYRVSSSLFVVDNLSNESNTRMRIRNPNGTINYNSSSDYRLKENDVKITDGIIRLKKLRPITFNWKSGTNTYDGFFAHEVSEACPQAVDGTKDQVATADDVSEGYANSVGDPIYQGIDHGKMVPLLTAALQESITKIEALEAEVAALKSS